MRGRSGSPRNFLGPAERAAVEAAIARAEARTSGEIRVAVVRRAKGDPLDEARRFFDRLGLRRTREKNGVLILLAMASRGFAILGDEGIHRHLGSDGWEGIRDAMAGRFREGNFAGGLVEAVERVGAVLAEHFPHREDDINELPDSVVEG